MSECVCPNISVAPAEETSSKSSDCPITLVLQFPGETKKKRDPPNMFTKSSEALRNSAVCTPSSVTSTSAKDCQKDRIGDVCVSGDVAIPNIYSDGARRGLCTHIHTYLCCFVIRRHIFDVCAEDWLV